MVSNYLHKIIVVMHHFVTLPLTANGYHQQYFVTTAPRILTNRSFKMMSKTATIIAECLSMRHIILRGR